MKYIKNSHLLAFLVSFFFSTLFSLAFIKNVPVKPDVEDIHNFDLLGIPKLHENYSYLDEINTIKRIQSIIINKIPNEDNIPDGNKRQIGDLILANGGLCFDRSRAIDQALLYSGFTSRHIYILYKDGDDLLHAILKKGQRSHAATEVLTSKGWLLVDSNSKWISLAKNNEPIPADMVQSTNPFEFESQPPHYMLEDFWVIPGLYTRGGNKYPPFIKYPELNINDLIAGIKEKFQKNLNK